MVRRERYKRLIMFFASVLVIGIQTLNFAYIWYTQYNFRKVMRVLYWRRGNWALIALYALILLIMSRLFGALKVGYMRVLDVILSQILSVIATNVIVYIQLALIGRWKFLTHLEPMLALTGVNLVVVVLWVFFGRWIYVVIYPPRQTILIYDHYDPDRLLKNLAGKPLKKQLRSSR